MWGYSEGYKCYPPLSQSFFFFFQMLVSMKESYVTLLFCERIHTHSWKKRMETSFLMNCLSSHLHQLLHLNLFLNKQYLSSSISTSSYICICSWTNNTFNLLAPAPYTCYFALDNYCSSYSCKLGLLVMYFDDLNFNMKQCEEHILNLEIIPLYIIGF